MAVPANAKELFDNLMPKALETHADKAKEVDASFFFSITGDGGGEWTLDCASATPSIAQGKQGTPQCSIETDSESFKQMLEDPQAGMGLFMSGKLKVDGDPMKAMQLENIFKLAIGD